MVAGGAAEVVSAQFAREQDLDIRYGSRPPGAGFSELAVIPCCVHCKFSGVQCIGPAPEAARVRDCCYPGVPNDHCLDGATATEEALIQEYLPLVRSVVGRLMMSLPAHASLEDLQSVAVIGLLQAIRNFDPTRGATLKTFASIRIRGAVLDELRRMDWVPRLIRQKARKVQDACGELEQRLGTQPSEQQMADEMGITLEDYRRCLDEIRPATFVCLEAVSDGGTADETTRHENLADESQENPYEGTARSELQALIAKRIRQLPPTQQKVLALFYYEDLNQNEIAAVFGVSPSRISQIHTAAILAMRAFIVPLENDGPFWPRPVPVIDSRGAAVGTFPQPSIA